MSASADVGDGLPAAPKQSSKTMAVLQRIGRSLMMPIAVLPAAAILLRLGQGDLLGTNDVRGEDGELLRSEPGGLADVPGMEWMAEVAPIIGNAGDALFQALPLLFAVGVAIGFARRADGSTALAALVGYLVFDRVSKTIFFNYFPDSPVGTAITTQTWSEGGPVPVINWAAKNPSDVLGGILIGVIAALLWQRFYRIKLPTWLGFFGGRRFVPIITAVTALGVGVVFGFVWPTVGSWIGAFGEWITGASVVGTGVYGVVNRLLLPFGLHHVVNSLVWFVFGSFPDPLNPGATVSGDLNRYFAGDPTAGGFMAGWFPVLMFGLPGAALAIWRAAPKAKRPMVGGLMISGALTAFVTGITEPIEFAFIFVAPLLYGVHVVLSGLSFVIVSSFGGQLGFGFSAGLIDLLLNIGKSNTEQGLLIILLGLVYFAVYYLVFYFLITKLNLKTPGREDDAVETVPETAGAAPAEPAPGASAEEGARPGGSPAGGSGAPGESDDPGDAERRST
ncbi:PTS transporter subunit EIIC [Allonocardiopsis opalescens]|uniref:PTS system N-acetylglucosamine-specific IIC component n=1 Tax=Allonocardiopsis opalescens TaxID=1144618 RepID=A0A2T0QC92_9ACTN|nr:PTS transporter subunit EIIC [Allonocardiopsis opalescens]PRY01525.1 PTS system N-acetylglucosamine-specific IIC component [Allonocardiopsis opalescens]